VIKELFILLKSHGMVSFVAWTSALVIMLLWLAMNAGRAHSQVRTNDVLECSLAKHV